MEICSLKDFVEKLTSLHPRLAEGDELATAVSHLSPETVFGVRNFTYASRDEKGQPVTMSALMVLPMVGKQLVATRLVLENRATQAADKNVPTRCWNIGTVHALSGSVLVSPDLMSFGASVDRPLCYIHAGLVARNTVDAVVAAQQYLIDNQLVTSPLPVVNTGHSQGGFDALAVHRYWETEASEEERRLIPLEASFCGSGPYVPDEQMEIISRKEKYLYGAYMVMNAMSHLYYHADCFEPGVRIEDFLTQKALETGIVERIAAKNSGNAELVKDLAAAIGIKTASLFQESVYQPDGALYQQMLAASRCDRLIGGWQPTRPITFYHATHDECVPVECMYAAQREWPSHPLVRFVEDEWHEETLVHRYSGGVFHRCVLSGEF